MSTNASAGLESTGTTDESFTHHVEPLEQGGEPYVRCEGCGRELLEKLGGADQLTHANGCSNA
ncbi:hypothetical protein NP511_02130 [Natrinema thermotolerans]|uniref:DUF8118 domain-containing protein n=1 Tax=Natrinema thermotolerans TaxID=121872 RepID=A0AAF0PD77_9EURY|nr:hypothetical protein [Natrinema thermotolerans]WPH65858.1 hypothetical protein HJTV4_gp35 [Haloarchaeal virus HJTV-4]QCC60763.1 hypothetical protein DVR14_19820 [Natrinema thermotolerans]QCC61641.1 hypothetical protein DVR14_23950 [Natrinema thermotolerans]WMT07809.1 hypothetical protein NP511_20845 [Natrinema thermotolerans]WMT08441.1 hypothetical protein NP511_02130 [Natrinema thermotolerans]